MAEAVKQLGPGEWDMKVLWLDPDQLVPNVANPNQQDDATFRATVESIETDGWTVPVTAVEIRLDPEGATVKYRIVAGEHRWRAAKVLGCKVPVLPLPPKEWEQDRQDWMLVKDNILKGRLNPEKFAQLYERMTQKYDADVLQVLMGFSSSDAFEKVYKDARDALPPDMQKKLDESKAEIKTIDDLSTVLNSLFAEFGETLPSNVMVFTWGKRNVFWVLANKDLWTQLTAARARISEKGYDTAEAFASALETWLGHEDADDEYRASEEGSELCGRQLAAKDPDTFNALQDAGAAVLAKTDAEDEAAGTKA